MSNAALIKVQAARASEVCANFYLPVEILELTRRGMGPQSFIETLLEKKQYLVAIDFLAHAVPAREAIWWGCLCLQHACGEKFSAADKSACRAAVHWVLQPSEENRVFAKTEADIVGVSSPAGALAAAASQTGGSIAPPNMPPVPPGPYAPAKLVGMSIKVAATKGEPAKMMQNQKSFVELGIGIAEGRYF